MPEDKLDVKIVKTVKRRLMRLRGLPRPLRRVVGVMLILVGAVTIVLPLPGSWILILVGLALISRDFWYLLEQGYKRYLDWRGTKKK